MCSGLKRAVDRHESEPWLRGFQLFAAGPGRFRGKSSGPWRDRRGFYPVPIPRLLIQPHVKVTHFDFFPS